ncbi:MAG: glycosyltransferase family 4 protein, partial [Actinobacteria bacterium]|nr:glycosyltransferase family 4 protein [Actinomycetota bacterium]
VVGDPPYVVHLHELETGLDRSIDPTRQASALAGASRVLAVSRPVADLAVRRGADPRQVELLPGVVEVSAVTSAPVPAGSATGRVVMGAGVPGWRKATDRVAAVAHELDRAGRPGAVGWVGGAPSGQDARWVSATDPVRWYEETDDPWAVMGAAEVVLVPSREDPLPLVALEAGLRSKAVVATPTGGLPDLLGEGRGAIAPTHDVSWIASTTARLLGDPAERMALGAALREEVLAHHDAAVLAPRWWGFLRDAAG